MKFTKLNGSKLVNVSTKKYLIDWSRKISGPQKMVSDFLYPYWKGCVVLCELRIPGSLFRLDLFNLNRKIAIEVSPDAVHLEYNKHFHKTRAGFLKKIKSDFTKREWCEKNNITLIELYDEDLKNLSYSYIKEKFDISL